MCRAGFKPHAFAGCWTALIVLVGALPVVFPGTAGCSRTPTPAAASRPALEAPRAVAARLIELREARQYLEMPALIVPPHGREVVEFLMAVDEFLAANQRLCAWLRDHIGVGLSQTVDQAYVVEDLSLYAGEDLGLFSRHVELLDAVVQPDEANVAYAIENHLPTRRVRLRNVGGGWQYDPGGRISDYLPAAFRELAHGLDLVRGELEAGRLSSDELRTSPNLLVEKVQARLRHGVGMLSKAQAARAGEQE